MAVTRAGTGCAKFLIVNGGEMNVIVADPKQVALCGVYCGACTRFLKGKCPGCQLNEKASWCKVRTCCLENSYRSCAECKTYSDPNDCGYFNNFMSRLFGFFLRSDRKACIDRIRQDGYEAYAKQMAESGRVSLR